MGRVSVPVWGASLSGPLAIVALVGRYPANQLMARMPEITALNWSIFFMDSGSLTIDGGRYMVFGDDASVVYIGELTAGGKVLMRGCGLTSRATSNCTPVLSPRIPLPADLAHCHH